MKASQANEARKTPIEQMQSRTIRQMLNDFGSDKDTAFFEAIANVGMRADLPILEDAFKSYCKFRRTKQPHLWTRFQREVLPILERILASDDKPNVNKYAEFITSVFVMVNQPVNFDLTEFEFVNLYKVALRQANEASKINRK